MRKQVKLMVTSYKAGAKTIEGFDDSIEATKDIVCQRVRDGKAEQVDILDPENGVLLFRYPLELVTP